MGSILRGDARVIVALVGGEERALLVVDDPETGGVYGAEDWRDASAPSFGFDGEELRQHDGTLFYGSTFEVVPCPATEAEAKLLATWSDVAGFRR